MKILGLYLPAATIITLVAMQVAGVGYDDLKSYVLELAPRSVYAIAIIGLAQGYMRISGLDVTNDERRVLQSVLIGKVEGDKRGAFLILAGESIASIVALLIMAAILLVWQG